jgi:hypothetical protein
MKKYRHPREARDFYAPDAEPSVDASLPILDISGLDDYSLPHPNLKRKPASLSGINTPNSGSGANGLFSGGDFRNAYAPNVSLTGAGQSVGLLEFDGYYSNDIVAYENSASLPNVPLLNVAVDGGVATPGSGNGEVALDIEMIIAMAPGVSQIIVFEAPNPSPWPDLLNRMVSSNQVKQLSCSWGGGAADPVSEGIFKQMALQGQSFFNASGDSDAFVGSVPFPSDSTNITEVGGTTLTMNGSGASYQSETVWNWGNSIGPSYDGVGSSGGVSATYALPYWQQGINMNTNLGSATKRNTPDVALTADGISIVADNGQTESVGGTSAAAPLWAAYAALINQQAVGANRPVIGFVNPALYAIGKGTNYAVDFHDITTGNNFWSNSLSLFPAVNGYDLCTGWGTPAGQSLINDLAGQPDAFGIAPAIGFAASGPVGGPFTPNSQNLTLTNSGLASLNWKLTNAAAWFALSASNGTLAAGGQATITGSLKTAATNLAAGIYFADVWFTNLNSGGVQVRRFTLQALQQPGISPATGFKSSGPLGGPFTVTSQNFTLSNIGVAALNWSALNTPAWLTITPSSGNLIPGGQTTVTVSLNSAASNLVSGAYAASVMFTNQTGGGAQSLGFSLTTGLPINGGFETGDFTGWTLNGDASPYDYVDNGSTTSITPHSGTYFAALGESGFLAYLSQDLPTVAGQRYLLSLWLRNSLAGSVSNPNEFSVSWNGSTLYDKTNLPLITTWTNLLFTVAATSTTTTLQFGGRNDNSYLGLDDVNVVPIPAPSLQAVRKTGGNFIFNWGAVTNVTYQVQYKTNLLQPNWINFGSTIKAASSTLTTTNAIATDPQRFYRVIVP